MNFGKTLLTIFLIILLGTDCSAAGKETDSNGWKITTPASLESTYEISKENIESFSDNVIEYARNDDLIPGVIVSIVKDGKVLLSKGYGWADEPNKFPADPKISQFEVASVSKTVTFTALMKLIESGELTLDSKVSDILEFKALDDKFEPITIRQLMTHTTGFEDKFLGESAIEEGNDISLMQYIRMYKPERVRPNGEYIVYSNYSSALAGAVIEKVSKMPFEQYIQLNILNPLGMSHSSFIDGKVAEEGDQNIAVGHMWQYGEFATNRQYFHHHGLFPMSGLKTTADDMAKYMLFHLTKGSNSKNIILLPETISTMHSLLKTNHPELAGNAHGFWTDKILGYSSLSHDGNSIGFRTSMVMIPELKIGVFISTNSEKGQSLIASFSKQLVAKFFPSKAKSVKLATNDDLSQYRGWYLSMRRNYSSIERMTANPVYIGDSKNSLTIYLGSRSFKLKPLGEGVFIDNINNNTLAFKKDKQGTMLILREGDVLERIDFWENNNNFMNFILITIILSGMVLFSTLQGKLGAKSSNKNDRIFSYLTVSAAIAWLVFYICLSKTISSFQGSILPSVFVYFPDTATLVGQWMLVFIILISLPLLYWTVLVWKERQQHWSGRTFSSIYFILYTLVLVWSLKFNLIGFQF